MRAAFKEWAIVVDVLGEGKQILIFRKGGIAEGRGGFSIEHPEFLLFPTLFHQQRESVLPDAQQRFDEISSGFPSSEVVRLEFFARIVAWKQLPSIEDAVRFKGQHIWRDDVVAQRFNWGMDKNIFILAVRVFRLSGIVEMPMRPAYGGCKSWIELEAEVSTHTARPVLDDKGFRKKMSAFDAALIDGAQKAGDFSSEPLPKP